MKKLIFKGLLLIAGILILAVSCTKDNGTISEGNGKLIMKITDAPFPVSVVDKVMVTVDKIEIRSVQTTTTTTTTTGDNDPVEGVYTVISDKVQEFDLLKLRNGITSDLLEIEIGSGTYDMIRMHITASKVYLKDGTSFDMKVPSGESSGLKIRLSPELVVEEGVINEVLIDFDLSKSFLMQGNHKIAHGIKGFIFKPVLRAMWVKQSGIIAGKVSENETTPVAEAHVQIMRADTVFSSALTDANGAYALIGVPAGTYKMVCEKEGYTSVTVDQVVVKVRETTKQNFTLTK